MFGILVDAVLMVILGFAIYHIRIMDQKISSLKHYYNDMPKLTDHINKTMEIASEHLEIFKRTVEPLEQNLAARITQATAIREDLKHLEAHAEKLANKLEGYIESGRKYNAKNYNQDPVLKGSLNADDLATLDKFRPINGDQGQKRKIRQNSILKLLQGLR